MYAAVRCKCYGLIRVHFQGCANKRQINERQTSSALEKKASYGGGALEFVRMMVDWREDDKQEGLETLHWG